MSAIKGLETDEVRNHESRLADAWLFTMVMTIFAIPTWAAAFTATGVDRWVGLFVGLFLSFWVWRVGRELLAELRIKKNRKEAGPPYYIWVNRGGSDEAWWWKPNGRGYTRNLSRAGKYTRKELERRSLSGSQQAVLAEDAEALIWPAVSAIDLDALSGSQEKEDD